MTGTAFDRVVDKVTANGGKIRMTREGVASAQCPAHEDGTPSLSVTRIEGQVLIYCHGGCDTDQVLDALDLAKSDLFDDPRGASYDYTDLLGTVTRTVLRSPVKKFVQKGDTKGTPILFRLPQVLQAIAEDKVIHLVEGEKDVLALESVGLIATTAPMGAGNFAKADVTPLFGADVVVIIDNDPAGQKWAAQVSDKLEGICTSLKFVQALEGKDAADHIAAGHGVDDFVPLELEQGKDARRARLTWANTIKPRPVVWAWKDDDDNGRIPAGSLSIAAGREGTGKSSFGIWMAAQITKGLLPGSYCGRPRKVLYVALEDSWEYTIVGRLMAAGADLSMVARFDVVNLADDEVCLSLPNDNGLLEQAIRENDVALVTIDPIMSVLGEKINASRSKEVRSALDPLVRIADRTGSVVLGIAHFNKGSSSDPTLSITESKAFTDVPRSVFTFARDDENDCRVMSQTKNSLGKDWTSLASLKYTIESTSIDTDEGPAEVGMFVWGGIAERSVSDIVQDRGDRDDRDDRNEVDKWLTDYLTDCGDRAPAADVIKAARVAGFNENVVKKARGRIKATSERSGFGKGASYTWVAPHGFPMGAMGATSENTESMAPMVAPMVNEDLVVLPGSRLCPECDQPVAAGMVRHRLCLADLQKREKSA